MRTLPRKILDPEKPLLCPKTCTFKAKQRNKKLMQSWEEKLIRLGFQEYQSFSGWIFCAQELSSTSNSQTGGCFVWRQLGCKLGRIVLIGWFDGETVHFSRHCDLRMLAGLHFLPVFEPRDLHIRFGDLALQCYIQAFTHWLRLQWGGESHRFFWKLVSNLQWPSRNTKGCPHWRKVKEKGLEKLDEMTESRGSTANCLN